MTAILDSFRLAFGTFFGNPLRSLLTLLGIVIGVATVIAMMALIEGLRMKVTEDLSQLGADSFQIQKMPQGFGRIDWAKLSKRPNFTLADREAIVDVVPVGADRGGRGLRGRPEARHRREGDPPEHQRLGRHLGVLPDEQRRDRAGPALHEGRGGLGPARDRARRATSSTRSFRASTRSGRRSG